MAHHRRRYPILVQDCWSLQPASRHWKPLSHQLFSNRNRMISEPRFFQTCWQPLLPRAQMHRKPPHIPVTVSPRQCGTHGNSGPVARVTSFPTPVELLVNSSADAPLQADSTEARPEEASIPRVCTSDSAENFANLLLNCVADSRKTLPLSEPSQLRMVAS